MDSLGQSIEVNIDTEGSSLASLEILGVCESMVDGELIEYDELIQTLFFCAAICAYKAGLTPSDYIDYCRSIEIKDGGYGHA